MTTGKAQKATQYAHTLDEETQATLDRVRTKNNKAIGWFIVSWTILLLLALFGIYYQNRLATQSKNHIDCIIKDLSTPLPAGAKARYIDYQTRLSADCRIKFTQ